MTRVSAGMRRCPNCGRDLENVTHPAPATEVDDAQSLAPRAPAPKLASLTLQPAEIRALVAATPELIEPGLRVYQDGGSPVGRSFPTPVGEIDLLAQDDAGGLVVLMVAEGEPDKEAVLELLERIGFVRTQVAETGQEVRGLLLAERLSEPTRYTIAALGGTVSIKSWRIALTFDDIPV